jgi:hypothetical protein
MLNFVLMVINCHSIVSAVGIRVPPRKLREFSAFSVSSALRRSRSARCAVVANGMQTFGHFQQKLSHLRALSRLEKKLH